jgi:purine/pyrimidine-nucleoside phosphorylase
MSHPHALPAPTGPTPAHFAGVTADTVANIYYEGKVISHTIHFADATKKTLGVIFPGTYHFGTAGAERMEISAGDCQVKVQGSSDFTTIHTGSHFDVPANSGFDIVVADGFCQYVCSYF